MQQRVKEHRRCAQAQALTLHVRTSMATGSIATYRLNEVFDKQAPRVWTRPEYMKKKLLRGEFEQPSIDLLHFPVHRGSRMGEGVGQRIAFRSLDRPRDRWADHARAGRAGLTSQHDCCYLVEKLAEFWYGLLRVEKMMKK